MRHRFTIEELNRLSDNEILRILVQERQSEVENPYSPLSRRLQDVARVLDGALELERSFRGEPAIDETSGPGR